MVKWCRYKQQRTIFISFKDVLKLIIFVLLQRRYFQPPSVCVNTAGITQDEFLLKMEEEDFDKVIGVNLKVKLTSG